MTAADSGGFLLSLVTESFAARALLGSLAAAALAAVLVGSGVVRTSRARRLVLLTPVLTAAVAAVASFGEVFLPLQLWLATDALAGGNTGLIDLFGEPLEVASRSFDLLFGAYAFVVGVLLIRRAVGLLAVRRVIARGIPAPSEHPVASITRRLAFNMEMRSPETLLLANCPGGAFAASGTRHGTIAIDPVIAGELDSHELEGLLAHELAHLRRKDTHLGTLVGIFRDVAFFLPPLHLTARWLRREQEESADELASQHTGRPVALASSILKVWDRSQSRTQLGHACGAVPARLTAAPSGVLTSQLWRGSGMTLLTARIERLIGGLPPVSSVRRFAEMGVAGAVLLAGTSAALTVPSWIATDLRAESVSFVVLSAPAESQVESAAFSTFRNLAPNTTANADSPYQAPLPPQSEACTCIESQAQLAAGTAAQGAANNPRLAWGASDRAGWEVVRPHAEESVQTARPLWTVTDAQTQVGFFVMGKAPE